MYKPGLKLQVSDALFLADFKRLHAAQNLKAGDIRQPARSPRVDPPTVARRESDPYSGELAARFQLVA